MVVSPRTCYESYSFLTSFLSPRQDQLVFYCDVELWPWLVISWPYDLDLCYAHCSPGTDTSTSLSSMSKVSMKGLSASTSQLSPRRRPQTSVSPAKSTTRLSTPHTNNSLSPARGVAGSTTALSPARANKAAGLRAAVSSKPRSSGGGIN